MVQYLIEYHNGETQESQIILAPFKTRKAAVVKAVFLANRTFLDDIFSVLVLRDREFDEKPTFEVEGLSDR